ncbi:MAG: hypothetical protein JNL28_17145 [Planctomycetes bacterium]|nr:hypothetical protein [Planctomycetota bacterium]
MRAPIRLAARAVLGVLLILGWTSLLLAIGLFGAEKTGLLRDRVRATLAQRLGPLGGELTIHEARLRWFEPALELDGVRIGNSGEWFDAEMVRASFAFFGQGGARFDGLELRGGRVRLSRTILDALQPGGEGLETGSKLVTEQRALPTVRIEDLDIELDTEHFGVIPIGRINALLRPDDRGRPELWGRIVPSLASSAAESGEIYLHGKMRDEITFEVRAAASHLPIGTDYLPAGTDIEAVREWEPRGVLELEAAALLSLDSGVAPRVRARVQVHDGGLRLGRGGRVLDNLLFDVGTTWTPTSWDDAFEPRAWRGDVRLSCSLENSPLEFSAIFGPDAGPGLLAKAWVHSPRLVLDDTLLAAAGNPAEMAKMWAVFEPRGHCAAWVAARLPASFQRGDDLLRALEIGGEARFDGNGGMTYHGFARANGVRDMGFPLPLERVSGGVVFAHDAERNRPLKIALAGLAGDSGSSVITASGLVQSHEKSVPDDAESHGYVEYDLALATRGLAVDDKLYRALDGLSGSLPPKKSWMPFHPQGGNVDVDLQLAHDVHMPYAALDLGLDLHGVSVSWDDLPIPITPALARLEFKSDGASERALAFNLEGSLRTARRIQFVARLQTDSTPGRPAGGGHLDDCSLFDVAVERVSLTGDDQKILVGQFPRIGAELDELAPKGFADVQYTRVRSGRAAATTTHVEVTPRDPAQLTPRQFQMITSGVRGRVLVGTSVDAAGHEETRTRLMPLAGAWGPSVPVAFMARFPERTVTVFGAGIDPSSKSLLGSLRQAMSSPGSTAVDTAAAKVDGPLDFVGEIKLGEGAGAKNVSNYRFFVHDSSLSTADGFKLDHLRGELVIENDQLIGETMRARLANTPVTLRDMRVTSNNEGFSLATRFEAAGVPIDSQHLAAFVDASTLDALIDELLWKGSLDVRDGRIVVTVPSEGTSRLEFSGQVIPHDMSIQLGLPITVKTATAVFDKLIYEGGKVRAIVHIDGFEGYIADRELDAGSMLVSYIEPKLTIENLSGKLAGGDVVPLGGDAARHGTVFSIALERPFGFQLALGLEEVEAAALLRGLFPSDMATRGRVDADLRLQGDLDHLLGIVGSGSIRVLGSRLWSIPVFRALFAQLGLDDTAVFESMATNMVVKDGRVEMNDITVRSPLLQLVGEGALDFDGGLKYDLEVRYDLIDRLGPFTRLLYSIQNKLLSVAIRGDMARPEIILENPFTFLFGRGNRDRRPLPLPPWAPLPPRF